MLLNVKCPNFSCMQCNPWGVASFFTPDLFSYLLPSGGDTVSTASWRSTFDASPTCGPGPRSKSTGRSWRSTRPLIRPSCWARTSWAQTLRNRSRWGNHEPRTKPYLSSIIHTRSPALVHSSTTPSLWLGYMLRLLWIDLHPATSFCIVLAM